MSPEVKPQRVGVLVVHGIGEQRQFEHLEEVVRNIATALQADDTIDSVQVRINASQDAAYGSKQQTWRGEGTATAIIEVIDKSHPQKQTNLEFKEVWWSDLDEPTSFKTFFSFWLWGLSLWTKPQYDQRRSTKTPGRLVRLHPDRRLPERVFATKENSSSGDVSNNKENKESRLSNTREPIRPLHRVYLLLVSFVILLLLPFLWVLGRVTRSILGFEIRPDLLVDYLGDVKLYQQDAREGKGPIVDLGKTPPRFAIRRRFIKALVEMELAKYDRWYILSHSLGTVVAFNGLMETEDALPRYLDQKMWKRWCRRHTSKSTEQPTEDKKAAQAEMLPQRPNWLSPDNDDIIDRKELFSRLRGVITYGSPLSKFALLWPLIVPLNKDREAFREDCEWINVFDPTDPVSDFTKFFDNTKDEKPYFKPREIPYKAEKIHLLSHGQYLTFNPKRKNPLVRQVAQWLVSGETFQEPQEPENAIARFCHRLGWLTPSGNGKSSLMVFIYFVLGILVWIGLGGLIAYISSQLIPSLLLQVPSLLAKLGLENATIDAAFSQLSSILSNPLSYLLVIVCTVFIVGIIARILGLNINRGVSSPSEVKDASR